MSLIAQLMRLSLSVPPSLVTATVLLAITVATLVIGLRHRGRRFLRHLPSIVFMAAGSAAFWTRWSGVALLATAALLVEAVLAYPKRHDSKDLGSTRMARRYLMVTLAFVAVLLCYHLGTYSGPLLTWEAPVVAGYPGVGGFAYAFNTGQTVFEYTLQRFLWDDGLLSAGHTSLFYGAPTYALFHVIGFSPWSLRIAAVLATLLSIGLIYALARRPFGPLVGAAAAVGFGLNSCVLFYGRYGSSPAGTILAVLLAVWCTWRFLDEERPAWWTGPACAAALFVATLQYSPARIVVLVLLGFLTVVLAWRWRRLRWQPAAGFAVIVLAAAGVWQLQSSFGAEHTFLRARGEQYFAMIQNPEAVRELFDTDLLDRPVTRTTIALSDKVELLYRFVQRTLPQFVAVLRPRIETDPLSDVASRGALPQLYYAPLVLFIAWGFTHSLLRLRAWPHACLLLWVSAATVPLLLTNRVDTHRIMLFVIPLSLWGAFGVWEAAQVLAEAQVPADIRHFFAALLALTVAYNDVHLLHRDPPPNIAAAAVAAEAARVPGRVAVGVLLRHRKTAWLQLAMLERTRRDTNRIGEMLDERIVRDAQDRSAPTDVSVRRLLREMDGTTVILAPAERFGQVAAALSSQGVRVVEHVDGKVRMLRLDAGSANLRGMHEAESSAPN